LCFAETSVSSLASWSTALASTTNRAMGATLTPRPTGARPQAVSVLGLVSSDGDRRRDACRSRGQTPVAGWGGAGLEVVVAPTGEACDSWRATCRRGLGVACARDEVIALMEFFERWLARTDKARLKPLRSGVTPGDMSLA